MKKYLFYELARRATRNMNGYQKQRLVKKIKYLAAFAFLFTLVIGGLAIWGTVAVVTKIAASVNPVVVEDTIAKGKEEWKTIGSKPITTQDCLDTLGGMLSPTRLLTVSPAQNIEAVRGACWAKPTDQENNQKQT